jgi:hypothetical protein
MPCIWGQHNGSQLLCAVVIAPPNLPAAPAAINVVPALIDTGASTTAITTALAALLNLQPIGIMPIHGVGGVQHHNSHLFRVGFPFPLPAGTAAPPGHPPPQQGQVPATILYLHKVIQGCAFHGANAPFQVLLGMDVISIGSLVVQGNGTFSFSF